MTDVISREELFRLTNKKASTRHIEHQIQCEIVKHFRALRKPDVDCKSIPNEATGGSVQKVTRYKRAGMWAGYPDLEFIRPAYGHPGFFQVCPMEVKEPKGSLSDNQRICQSWLRDQGYPVVTIYSVEEALDQLAKWGLLR